MKSKIRRRPPGAARSIAPLPPKWFIEKMNRDILRGFAPAPMYPLPYFPLQACTSGAPNLIEEPRVGMEFPTEKSAYDFYNEYARKVGFSVRKSSTNKVDGCIIRRAYCCCKQGVKREKETASFRRAPTRTNCSANMAVKLHTNGNYLVTRFESKHNHYVVPPSMVHLLRSHRDKADSKKDGMSMPTSSAVTPEAMEDTGEIQSIQDDKHENLGFQPIDCNNYVQRKQMKKMEKGDAAAILEYFQKKQVEDPSFFYAAEVDVHDQITNFFWVDTKSVVDYGLFGDVVCFDMSYRLLNSYCQPFAPIYGVNHQQQIIVFGAALLYDETVNSFKWLFETFLSAMSGKKPVTILTDRCEAVANAIKAVFPTSSHRLCAWQIFQNAKRDLNNVFHGSKSFEADFGKCIYQYEDEEAFFSSWQDMLVKYGLTENKWLQDLFELREKWASAFGRHAFCADMRKMYQSESVNNVLKKYLSSQYDFLHFFENYEEAIAECRYNEVKFDFDMRQVTPRLFTNVKMLREASMAYTPDIFELFQKEYKLFLELEHFKCGQHESGAISEFQVTCSEKSVRCTVTYDSSSSTVTCSCKKFEFMGILCCHALKVLDIYNIKMLPHKYVLRRWRRDVKAGIFLDNHGLDMEGDLQEAARKRFNILFCRMIMIADVAAKHDETLKIAEQYYENLHEGIMEFMNEFPQHPSMPFNDGLDMLS